MVSGARSDQSGTESNVSPEKNRQDAGAEVRLRAFTTKAGGGCVATIDHVGRVGARVVAIAPSGAFGDVLASSVAAAEAICERIGLPVRPWDRETTGLLSPSPGDRAKMGTRNR